MRPLFLLCGLLCDETIWADIPSRLAPVANAHVMSFAGFSSIAGMAERELAAAPPRFALAGHSMGGRVALEVWRQAPERVTALALLNTGVHPTRESEYDSRGLLVRLARRQGMAALADEWLPPMIAAPRRPAGVALDHGSDAAAQRNQRYLVVAVATCGHAAQRSRQHSRRNRRRGSYVADRAPRCGRQGAQGVAGRRSVEYRGGARLAC